ncbi:MAG: hypothetical protein U0235_06360 [Polyangiaceae bacterium]
MDQAAHVARIEHALREIAAAVAKVPPSPKTREFRARAATFERALLGFNGRQPRPEQTSALLEAVVELHSRVFAHLPRPSMAALSRPAMRAALSQPRITAVTAPRTTTAPPPPRSSPPGVTLPPPSGGRRTP